MEQYEGFIVGGGGGGLAAGLYTSRAGLKSLLLERGAVGGQMVNATLIENYPGFPEGISGAEPGFIPATEDLPQVVCKASRGQSADCCPGLHHTSTLRKE